MAETLFSIPSRMVASIHWSPNFEDVTLYTNNGIKILAKKKNFNDFDTYRKEVEKRMGENKIKKYGDTESLKVREVGEIRRDDIY